MVILKLINIFIMCVCIKTALFSKLCELHTKTQGNLFTKHKMQEMQLGI